MILLTLAHGGLQFGNSPEKFVEFTECQMVDCGQPSSATSAVYLPATEYLACLQVDDAAILSLGPLDMIRHTLLMLHLSCYNSQEDSPFLCFCVICRKKRNVACANMT